MFLVNNFGPSPGGNDAMSLVDADLLATARELSWGFPAAGLAVGLLLWLFGGRTHRFWLVLGTTLLGGVLGIRHGAEYGLQPLVGGLLLAVALGALALSLVRVLLFLAVGALAAWGAHVAAPAWGEPLPVVCFFAGGLAGVLLYRVWVAALSSLAGTLLFAYSILCLVGQLFPADVAGWAGQQAEVLNWAVAVCAVLGVLVQFLLERRAKRLRAKAEAQKKAQEEAERYPPYHPSPPRPKPWWQWEVWGGSKKKYKQAG
jgi:hypothetical protein